MCLHERPFELETSEDITKVFRNEEMEDEEMEFMDGTWKKEINTWEELVGNNLLNQEAVIEGAVHSIRNMGDVAFIILRRREGLFQTVYENEMANVSIHELKEAMTIMRVFNSIPLVFFILKHFGITCILVFFFCFLCFILFLLIFLF